MKKRCAIAQKKLNELESILHKAALSNVNDDRPETNPRVLLLCDEIEQKSFFLHRLLKAEISSCPSPPTEEGHLMHIERCFQRLHHAYHEWTENFETPALLEHLGSKVGPEPECTASCFNTDDDEDEDIGEFPESIISTQMSDNPMELEEEEYFDDVPAVQLVSVGVQTDNLQDEIEEEKSTTWFNKKDPGEMIKTNFLWNENPVAEELYEEEEVGAGAEEEEEDDDDDDEEEESVVLVQSMEKRKRVVREGMDQMGMAKGVVLMGSAMMMGFMIGRFYYTFVNPAAAATATYSNGCFDYYSVGGGGGGGRGGHYVLSMLPT